MHCTTFSHSAALHTASLPLLTPRSPVLSLQQPAARSHSSTITPQPIIQHILILCLYLLFSTDVPPQPPAIMDGQNKRYCDSHRSTRSALGTYSLLIATHDTLSLSSDSAHCSSHTIDIPSDNPPPLLDVIRPIRSLTWQYMDNRSAIRYLSTCKQLHALYHTFPLTEPVSAAQLQQILSDRVDGPFKGLVVLMFLTPWCCASAAMLLISRFANTSASRFAAIAIGAAFLVLPFILPVQWWCPVRPPPHALLRHGQEAQSRWADAAAYAACHSTH